MPKALGLREGVMLGLLNHWDRNNIAPVKELVCHSNHLHRECEGHTSTIHWHLFVTAWDK